MHILSHSAIQDVKDSVPLGQQLHLTKKGLPSDCACLSGPWLALWVHSLLEPQPTVCWGSVLCCDPTRMGMRTVTATAQ